MDKTPAIRSRVEWNDGEGHWPGMITAIRDNDYVVVKLDSGGTFAVHIKELRHEEVDVGYGRYGAIHTARGD